MKRIFFLIYLLSIGYLNAGVDTVWTRRYNSLNFLDDGATALAVDVKGNVYVTGTSIRTAEDFLTIKYNSIGEILWMTRYDGNGHRNDIPVTLFLDGSGNIYEAGMSERGVTGPDYAILKYDSNGKLLRSLFYDGGAKGVDYLEDMVVDDAGNIYITGESEGKEMGKDYATIKYDREGWLLWVRRYDGGEDDCATALTIDRDGNVYVTGKSYSENNGWDCVTIKYDSAGNMVWKREHKGEGDDYPISIAISSKGDIYVAGTTYGGEALGLDYLILKYNVGGTLLWERYHNGSGSGNDSLCAFVVDKNGDVYITGESWNGHDYDYLTLKYSSEGDSLWARSYNGPVQRNDCPTALTIDRDALYVTGGSSGHLSSWDYATIKYSKDGEILWIVRYDSPYKGTDIASSIVVDESGYVYVTGSSWGGTTWRDYLTIKYYETAGVEESFNLPIFRSSITVSPNPFKAVTRVEWLGAGEEPISLEIYDASGRLVRTLAKIQTIEPKAYTTVWDGRDSNGKLLPSGVYFCKLKVGNFKVLKKVILLR